MTESIEHIVAEPVGQRRETPIFLMHGLSHSAACWARFMEYLPTLGYEVHAISMPGHGGSSLDRGHISKYGFYDYLDFMSCEIAKVNPPPVLVGHSLGGMMTMKYLEKRKLPGAVLVASTPHKGVLPLLLRVVRTAPSLVLHSLSSPTVTIPTPQLARKLFLGCLNDIDDDELFDQLCPDSAKLGLEMVFRIRPRTDIIGTPTFVIAGEEDACISLTENYRLAKALKSEFLSLPDQGHDIMLEPGWQEAADAIHKWVTDDLNLP